LTGTAGDRAHWLIQAADEPLAYLTTTGRRTGQPHRIEIWFAAEAGRIYLMAGGRDRSDWVRNLQANPLVTVELAGETHTGVARLLPPHTPDDQRARALLVARYQAGNDLDEWGRTSLAIVVEFPRDDAAS
jgi:deazaflavin-dependent oxidoreductase (nitroreductase family)